MAATCDDDMIQKTYVEETATLLNTLRELLILSTRLGTARRMIMHQNNLYSKQFQSTFEDKAIIDNRSLHATLTDAHALNYTARRCEVQHPALLMLQASELWLHNLHHVGIRAHLVDRCRLGNSHATPQLGSRFELQGTTPAVIRRREISTSTRRGRESPHSDISARARATAPSSCAPSAKSAARSSSSLSEATPRDNNLS